MNARMMTALVLMLASATPSVAAPAPSDLKATSAPSYGVQIATYLNPVISSLMRGGNWNAYALASYDPAKGKIVIEVWGHKGGSADSSKGEIGSFRSKILGRAIEQAKRTFGLDLSEDHLIISYGSIESNKIMVTYADGKFEMN